MKSFKRLLKLFYVYVFTIDKDIKKSNHTISRRNHIKYRVILILLLLPILYAIFLAFRDYGFTVFGTFKLILLLFIIRILGKEIIDALISVFFYKSHYQISLKERRKLKLSKIKRKFILRNLFN